MEYLWYSIAALGAAIGTGLAGLSAATVMVPILIVLCPSFSGEAPAQAASREMREELGVTADPAGFLGQLPTVYTPLGQKTNVYVCTISQEDAASVRHNPAEVSEILRVPVSCILRQPNAASYPYGDHEIWGMTAGAIRHLRAAWARAGIGSPEKNDTERV